MRSKFSTLAISCLLYGLVAVPAYGQTASPSRGAKPGFIRFWNMLPPTSGRLEVRKVGSPSSEAPLLSGIAYVYSSYTEFPSARYRLTLTKAGEDAPLKLLDIDLKPDSYFTILVSPQAGTLGVEVFDDTIDPKATTGTLTVRNFFIGTSVTVSFESRNIVEALPYGKTQTVGSLPLLRVPLTLHTRLPNGKPAESGAEADLRASKRATLLIIPDSYGRFCVRVALDGKN